MITLIDELRVFADEEVVVIRKVLTDTEALKTIGDEVFRMGQLKDNLFMNEDGVSGQSGDAVTDGSG